MIIIIINYIIFIIQLKSILINQTRKKVIKINKKKNEDEKKYWKYLVIGFCYKLINK